MAKPRMFRPERVVVPKPEFETLSHGAVVEPIHREKRSPATESIASLADGEDVEIPTRPLFVKVVVAVPPK